MVVVTEEESRDYGSGAPSPSLETMATMWLQADRRMYQAVHGKSNGPVFGILLPDQLRMRYEREVYNRNGVADPAIESGIYHRAYNPQVGRRPRRKFDPHNDGPAHHYDSRVGMEGNHVGWSEDLCGPHRDPAWSDPPGQNRWHHLDRMQRSRIRATLRKLPQEHLALRDIVRRHLSATYGVPVHVIVRVELSGL
ncbi:hypothetical protein BI081_gp086 [Mycobacterium phage Tonenili]|uniref:Uncharacterized protein n=1 Tax=Mycobacterium phage Tonenili TaxID=1891703 RepID=A0A1C9EH66_9CAUD|nr:hypothetical protein BI081_gp086 [Mycobacterium phage Tonenili]AON96837.1 hypothetical protein SEA_TONENILI_86 [Mycobacterium phage Tonenili]